MPNALGLREKAIFMANAMGGVVAFEVVATNANMIKGSVMLPGPMMRKIVDGRVQAVEDGSRLYGKAFMRIWDKDCEAEMIN